MSKDRNSRDLTKKRDLLERLQENYRHLRAYLALATHDTGELVNDRDIWAREGWVSRHTRTRRLREQRAKQRRYQDDEEPQSEETREATLDLLNRKIASYRRRVRRTSVQLLLAAAAGHQYRETNIATKQGGLIQGIDPAIPRKHRAFDVRSTPSLTSNEAAARAVKHRINRRKAGLDTDSDGDYSDGGGNNSSTPSSTGSDGDGGDDGDDDDDDDGSVMVKMAMAMTGRPIHTEPPLFGKEPVVSPLAPNRAYHPAAEDPGVYDPRYWILSYDTGIEWLKDDVTSTKFKNSRDYTPIGRMTWKEQEKAFPVLSSIFRMRENDKSELWDPVARVQNETTLPQRPPLEADINTLLSLERQVGFGRREMNPMYRDYPRLPLDIPEKLSEEEMRRGPLPAPPWLPLIANSGREVRIAEATTPPFVFDRAERKQKFLDMIEKEPLPVAHYHYPIDSPAVSAFKFNDGRQVSDTIQPGPLDEPRQVGGSQAIADYGREIESRLAKDPYLPEEPESMPPRHPPDFKPEGYGAKITQAKKVRFSHARKLAEKRAEEALPRVIRRERAARRAARANRGKSPSQGQVDESSEISRAFIDNAATRHEYMQQRNAGNPFWHFQDVKDSESRLHNDPKKA